MSKKKNDFISKVKALKPGKELLKAVEKTDRSLFFDPFFSERVDDFDPIPVGFGEYSDEAGLLIRMLDLLSPEKDWNILEVGTGSGYSTSLLALMCSQVLSIDYHEKLAAEAKARLLNCGIFNVKFLAGDCSELDDMAGTFDGAIIHAGCMHSPYAVLNLLKEGGDAVFPMGPKHMQQITVYHHDTKEKDPFKRYTFFETCSCGTIKGSYGPDNINMDIIAEMEGAEKK